MEDYELIDRVIDGDESAYEELYNKYATKVLNYISYNFLPVDEAEDLMQETFVLAYKNIKLYDKSKASFYRFLLKTAERITLTYLRKTNNRKRIFDNNLIKFVKEDEIRPDEIFESKIERKDLAKAIDKLSDAHKMAINLIYLKNLSYKDAARVMDRTESSFKSLLYRAKIELRNNMEEISRPPQETTGFKHTLKVVLILSVCMTMITGLVYATIKMYQEMFSKPKYTLSELREEVPPEESAITKLEATKRINDYLTILGRNGNVSEDELHLVRDFKINKICWIYKEKEYYINIDSYSGELVSYVNYEEQNATEGNISEIYKQLGLPTDYEIYSEGDIENSKMIRLAKKYGDIYNFYESVTFTIYEDKIKSIIVLDYPYEDKEVLISKEDAIKILEENNIEYEDLYLSIEKLKTNNYIDSVYEYLNDDNVQDEEIYKISVETRKVWKVIGEQEYLIDSNTGEIINNGQINEEKKNS